LRDAGYGLQWSFTLLASCLNWGMAAAGTGDGVALLGDFHRSCCAPLELKVQVGSGGPSVAPAKWSSLADGLAALNVDFAQVGVDGFVAITALDENHIAVAVCTPANSTVPSPRCVRCTGLVKSVPGSAPLLQNQVKAHRKPLLTRENSTGELKMRGEGCPSSV
jgi:hypothetical protein